MTSDEKPNINKQLRDAQEQRELLLEQLKQSEAIIDSIESRLSEVTKIQEARLRADDRVDNKLLDQVQNNKKSRPDFALELEISKAKKKKGDGKDSGAQQIISGSNSWYEIIVDEDGNKKERLRD